MRVPSLLSSLAVCLLLLAVSVAVEIAHSDDDWEESKEDSPKTSGPVLSTHAAAKADDSKAASPGFFQTIGDLLQLATMGARRSKLSAARAAREVGSTELVEGNNPTYMSLGWSDDGWHHWVQSEVELQGLTKAEQFDYYSQQSFATTLAANAGDFCGPDHVSTCTPDVFEFSSSRTNNGVKVRSRLTVANDTGALMAAVALQVYMSDVVQFKNDLNAYGGYLAQVTDIIVVVEPFRGQSYSLTFLEQTGIIVVIIVLLVACAVVYCCLCSIPTLAFEEESKAEKVELTAQT